jgi:hypothetical protein
VANGEELVVQRSNEIRNSLGRLVTGGVRRGVNISIVSSRIKLASRGRPSVGTGIL